MGIRVEFAGLQLFQFDLAFSIPLRDESGQQESLTMKKRSFQPARRFIVVVIFVTVSVPVGWVLCLVFLEVLEVLIPRLTFSHEFRHDRGGM
mmetsp:Transcript_28519/g.63652  ORF Transcript_28519/g.63652 Transcript_28519/m.63652 type:complete len:92 (+) Transcript_28519:3072-3347(+)